MVLVLKDLSYYWISIEANVRVKGKQGFKVLSSILLMDSVIYISLSWYFLTSKCHCLGMLAKKFFGKYKNSKK